MGSRSRLNRPLLEALEARTLFSVVIPMAPEGGGGFITEPVQAIVQLSVNSPHLSYGHPLTFTAHLTTALPVNSENLLVSLSDLTVNGPVTIGTAALHDDIATFTWLLPPAGSHAVSASIVPNVLVTTASSAPLSIQIDPALTTLSLIQSAAALVAKVRSAAPLAGVVTFFDGASPVAAVPLDSRGNAAFSLGAIAPGDHHFTASYSGTQNLANAVAQATVAIPGTPSSEPAVRGFVPTTSALSLNLDWLKSFTDSLNDESAADGSIARRQRITMTPRIKLLATSNALPPSPVVPVPVIVQA